MKQERAYLVVYDWACGQLMSMTEFASVEAAEAQRREVAAAYEDDASIEVSVVLGDSAEAARRRS
jgi:hypothetical protein